MAHTSGKISYKGKKGAWEEGQEAVSFPFIDVEWVDSAFHTGWQPLDEVVARLISCEPVGFLIKDTEDCLLEWNYRG